MPGALIIVLAHPIPSIIFILSFYFRHCFLLRQHFGTPPFEATNIEKPKILNIEQENSVIYTYNFMFDIIHIEEKIYFLFFLIQILNFIIFSISITNTLTFIVI